MRNMQSTTWGTSNQQYEEQAINNMTKLIFAWFISTREKIENASSLQEEMSIGFLLNKNVNKSQIYKWTKNSKHSR